MQYLLPVIEKVTPAEYHKWLPLAQQKYVSRGIGISIAWWLQPLVSAAHSAICGAELIVESIFMYAIRHDYVTKGTSTKVNPQPPPQGMRRSRIV